MKKQRICALILGVGLLLVTYLLSTDRIHDNADEVVAVSSEHVDEVVAVPSEHIDEVVAVSSEHHKPTRRVLPQCIIAGVMKCGTRALLTFLDLHTDVTTRKVEMHFFGKNETYKRGLEWYRQQMPLSEPHQLTLEKTPGYFIMPDAPEQIRDMNSSIRLLFVVRDPVVRMISNYVHMKIHHDPNLPKFEDVAIDHTSGRINTEYLALQISLYHVHLKRWLKYFNRTQIHIVDGEMLISDPSKELEKVETFLQIEHQLSANNFRYNERRGFYCSNIGKKSKCLDMSKGRPHPPVEQKVLDTLCQFFKPHNQIFFEMIGQNFTWC